MMAADEQVAAPPKKRTLPFKRTVARKQPSTEPEGPREPEEDNDLDLFRHSKEVFPEILREFEETEKQQRERKRRKLSTSSSDGTPSLRKQSTALDGDSDDDISMDVKGKGKEVVRARGPLTPVKPASARLQTPGSSRTTTQTPATRRSTSRIPAGSPECPVTISDSEDSDSDPIPIATPSKPTKHPQRQGGSSSPIEVLPADPFLSPTKPTIPTPDDDQQQQEQEKDEEKEDFNEWIAKARALQAAEAAQQAVVQVILTSPLTGGVRPVIAKRRLNQGVQLLLETWIAKTREAGIAIPEDVAAGLFLTWKGHKIYGHSTLASLGVQVDAQGNLKKGAGAGGIGGGGGGSGGEGYKLGGIHLEVWTDEAYAEYLENRGKERALMLGDGEDELDGGGGESAGEEEAPPSPVPQRKKGFKIVLKAKDHEPLKLTARDETNVQVLIEAFRTQRDIGPEWDVAIWFDGEKLDEDALITDIDVDPEEINQLEVHVKKAGR